MAKQLNVNLAFTADTGKVKAQLQDLQKSLTNLINTSSLSKTNGFSDQLFEASKAAAELKIHLQNATNIKTGNLDFTKLNDSIAQSGKSLIQYGESLTKLGPEGQQAFMKLTQSVANAEVPIRRSNALLSEMWTTLKNTARWQISSSILHGFMGAVQSAYGYAQDLNESLNNIRIVTGQNIDQMASFADQAQRAAKALSTTTTAYTNAALIYYQQGDSDDTVLQKTDVTTKMANVTGQSAEIVSNQLTAIWNNFNKSGEESYEKYADILTALGAATASSTDEIAGGLEKFASIADTIGLSYEYAATALATITATTRQSEDVVGTALKTIFARIQGLNLGETLDDGTSLNKYSEALAKVGINIFKQSGELKTMDAILDEMGSKWNDLSDDQQIALAQTVAGVRQYNQLVSLMDNWDVFGENLSVAENSTGELDKQQKIYEESWRAASDRVKASLEGIYDSLVDDEAFIDILNTIEKIITYFDNLIDTVGGLSGVLTTLGAILTRVFSAQIAKSISNTAYSLKMMTPAGQKAVQEQKSKFMSESVQILANMEGSADTTANDTASKVYTQKLKLQEKMIENADRMNDIERQTTQLMLDQLDVQGQQAIAQAKAVDAAKTKKSNAVDNIYTKSAAAAKNQGVKFDLTKVTQSMEDVKEAAKSALDLDKALEAVTQEGKASANSISLIEQAFNSIPKSMINDNDISTLEQLLIKLENIDNTSEDWETTLKEIKGLMGGIETAGIDGAASAINVDSGDMRDYSNAVKDTFIETEKLNNKTRDLAETNGKVGESIDKANGKQKTWADSMVSFANGALSVISALQMIGGIVDTLQDPDMSGWEKILSVGSSILMMVTMLAPVFTSLQGVFAGTGAAAAGATGPVIGFGAALNAGLGPIGWVALALTALVAIFAVIITSMDTASEKAQKHFNQMSEEAQHAAEALEEAKTAFEELEETIDSYSTARDKIDSLTQGTKEFEQAIIEANDAARILMETYGVAGNFNANTGLIEIDEKELKKAREEEYQNLESARINNTAAQTNKLMASSDLANAKAVEKNDFGYWDRVGETLSLNVSAGMTIGAATAAAGIVTAWTAPVTAAIGGLIGALVSFGEAAVQIGMQNSNNNDQIAALETLQEAYIRSGGNLESAMGALTDSEKSLIDSLGLTDTELANLCSEVSANTAAILQNNKQIVDEHFKDNAAYQNSKYKNELNTILGSDLKDLSESNYETTWKDKGAFGGGITDEDAQKEYAAMMGYTWVQNKDGNVGVYSKGDGSADFTISDETARRALAQRDALEALGLSIENYNKSLENVNATGEKFGKGVGDLMLSMAGGNGSSFAEATSNEIDAMKKALESAAEATDIISDIDAQNLGYEDAADYVEAMRLGIASYDDGMAQVGKNLSDNFSHGFLNNTEELTLAGAKSMAKNLTSAFQVSGSEAANTLDGIFVSAGEDADELSAILEGVNWGDPNAIDKLNDAIKEQGLDIDITSSQWKKYTELMAAAGILIGGVHSKFSSLRQTLADTNSLTKDLEVGGIISDEEYNKLKEINPLIKEMFTITAEGYQFTGNKSALENILIGNVEESIANVKSEFEALSSEGKSLTNINWFDEEGNKAFSSDRHAAMIADYASDEGGINLDNALAYMGVSKESLQEASDYILEYTDEQGNILTDAEGFDQAKYDEYVTQVQGVYDQLALIRQSYLDGDFSEEQAEQLIASTANTIAELKAMYANEDIGAAAYDSQLTVLANKASSLEELREIRDSFIEGEAGLSDGEFGDALVKLAGKYDNCTDEIEKFNRALLSGKKGQIEAAQSALELSVEAGELAKKYNLDAKSLENYSKRLKNNIKDQNLSEKAALNMAVASQRLDRGIKNVNDSFDDYKKILKDENNLTAEFSETMDDLKTNLADIFNVADGNMFSDTFAQALLDSADFQAALNGDIEALNRLRASATVDIGDNIITSLGEGANVLQTEYRNAAGEIVSASYTAQSAWDYVRGVLSDGFTLEEINDENFVESLNQMIQASGMTKDQIQSMLGSMGVSAEVVTDYKEMETEVPTYTEVSEPLSPVKYQVSTLEDGTPVWGYTQGVKKYTVPGKPMKVMGYVPTYSLKTTSGDTSSGGQIDYSNVFTPASPPSISSGSTGGNSGGGGGGSQPKKAEPTKKSEVVQRYKETEDKLDDVREEADRLRASLDKLYGAEHEAALQRLLELEQQEIDLLREKEQEAQNYLQEDLKELKKVSAEVDIEFKFDDNNNIENYEEEMTKLYEELAEIQRKAGDEWDENEQKEIDALNEKIKKLEEAMAAYEETRELLEDINAELDAFKGKPALPLITSDSLDIYWEINDALDDIDEQIKDLERRAEGLSGEEKLKVLEEINRLEQDRVAILQQQAELNQNDIEEKRAALDELARLNGLQFQYDDNNNIINYQEQMGILQAQLDELYAKRTADGSLSPADEEAVNSIIAKMKELEGLAVDFRNAVEESEDIFNEIEDTLSGIVADPFVRSDFVDIFKETNDQLDDIDRKISKLQNEADKLTGEARRKKLNEIVTLERKRVEILEHQALIAKTEMEDRKRAMEEIAARQELMFEYDENQNITNYQEQLDVLIDKYEKAYNEALGDDGLIDATEQAILDSISDDIDHLEEFIQAYCDAVDQLEDIEDEREELVNGGYVDMSQLDDIADELHDINQSLDDLQELLDDSARAADRLYGEARIKQMEKNASLLQQEIDLLQQKKTAQDDIIAKEKQQLDEKTGGYIKYDEYGRITNYDSYINAREDQIREYEAALQEGGLSETEATLLQDEIDLLNEQIAAMEDYEQALEEKEDIQNQIEDAYYEWQDLNAEKLQYKLELQLDVNDRELAKIERAIQRLDGNFYSRAEALALMVGGGMNGDSKLGNYNKQLADLEAHYQEVKRQYEAGEISQAKYVEMTKELQAEIESTADAMAALQDQMDSYYKDTLAQARQELNFHISQLTHLTGILNHFKNTLTALGKSKDYEMMGTVLEGQVQALENEVKASKNAMQMWQKEADSIYQKYQQALSSGNQENADMYYNAYKEALSAANEAENKFYQQSAAWANALRALMENTLAGLAQDLENALTGGTSFDTITTQMKRASSLQEEYLTTTNKIYETTKLMRTAQQEIDKTTNSVAKQKLSQFITETKQMQNQNKLSKYELSIQQAKYDLLVAEIALEEARFAKSTVRLRRDSEGNFGYVYTADAEAIATAEQKFEDAQNKLYNIGLDGANKYTEKYQQTLAEMYNTLTSLQTKYLQGGFESEAEYNAAVLEAKEYYYEKLNQYSELYSIAINAESGTLTDTLVNNSGIVTDALTKNSRIAADAWSTDFADMTTKTDQWMVAVTDYLSQVQNAFADWEVESQRIANETVGTDLTTLKNKVNDIVTESNNLTAAIGDQNSGVIKAIQDEIAAVSGLVTEYANLNGQLTQAIQNAQDLANALQQDIDQAGQDENPPGQYAPGEEEGKKPGTVVPEDTGKLPDPPLPEDPPHEHYYVKSKTSPTCTEKGYTTYTCSCGDTYDGDFIDALGHDYTSKVIEEATYEHGNLIRYTCQRCGDTYEEYDNNKKDKPKVEGSGKVENPVKPIKPEPPPTKPAEPAKPVEPDNSDKVEGVAASIWMDGSDVSGWGTGNTRKNRLKEKGVSKAQDYINKHAENGDIYAAWHNKRSQLKQYYYGKFDTGGYTGAWGPEGKWAMLHEKEIVLNKEDTKNFLASLELLDNILSTIDLHAMNSQWASNLISPDVSSIGKEALEQMVNIEASFPNATDKHEIEEAFKDLVNLASQYANRK